MTRKLDNRSAILAAAEAAFLAGGGELEMGDVAKRAGVSIGLAYHYFDSKSGLISAIVAAFYDRYDTVVNRRIDGELPWGEREYLRLLHAVRFLFEDPVAPLIVGRMGASSEVAMVEATRRGAIIEMAVSNIRRGQERGEIDSLIHAELAASFINGGLREAVSRTLARPGSMDAESFTKQAWGLVAGGLGLALPSEAAAVSAGI